MNEYYISELFAYKRKVQATVKEHLTFHFSSKALLSQVFKNSGADDDSQPQRISTYLI